MTSGRDIYYTQAHSEIWAGKDALKNGNKGMARVCARRACFWAISFWTEMHDITDWGESALSLLKAVKNSDDFPNEIKNAASRLLEKVNPNFEVSHDIDPLEDAEKIVEYFLHMKNL